MKIPALAVAVLAIGLALAACGGPSSTPIGSGGTSAGWQDELTRGSDKLDVATTVAPISSIARNIGGDRIRLHGIVPDATNSHTFEPAPSDAQVLANADLIVANGLHLEEPTLQLAEASKRPEVEIKLLGDTAIGPEHWLFDFS